MVPLHIQHHTSEEVANPRHYCLYIGRENKNTTPKNSILKCLWGCDAEYTRHSNRLGPAVLTTISKTSTSNTMRKVTAMRNKRKKVVNQRKVERKANCNKSEHDKNNGTSIMGSPFMLRRWQSKKQFLCNSMRSGFTQLLIATS